MARLTPSRPGLSLPGIEAHPHALALLGPSLPPLGTASHAYLFHGPPGSGKRTIARAFAAALLADGALDPAAVGERVARGTHPDLTWVKPSGANEMLVGDIQEAVLGAIARTPFESLRRVFVIEASHTMSDQVANRLLKTLEEPPSFAHLILLAHRLQDVLPTISSRCQPVRFDPLPSALIEQRLEGSDPERLAACARLALGDARLAALLASEPGRLLRDSAQGFVRGALHGRTHERRWLSLLEHAKAAGVSAGQELLERLQGELELLPSKERKRHQREALEGQRRLERRERTRTLDLSLRLGELWLRDAWLVAEGTPELIHATDLLAELQEDAALRSPATLRQGVELVAQTRLRLPLNVSEELALEALAYRLELLLASTLKNPQSDPSGGAANSGATCLPTASRSTTTAAR